MTKDKRVIRKALLGLFMICFCAGFVLSASTIGMISVKAADTQTSDGFVKKNGKTYYYQNGKKVKGLKTINGAKYYFSNKGVMAKKCFKTIKKKKYYFAKNGRAYTGLKTIGKNLYYFDARGVMQKGWQTIGENTYYFQSSGKAVKNQIKKIENIFASFDENGVYQITASYCMAGLRRMQVQYLTDPIVKDETLFAAILYAEAGGETQTPVQATYKQKDYTLYQGQLAVGYTILNRLENGAYPATLKDVIYQQYQFEPARTGRLTELLQNPSMVSSTCKNTAKILLNDYKNRTSSVEEYRRSDFGWYNFWALSYAQTRSDFFSVYKKNEYNIIGNQVFFNYTKPIHSF